MKDKFTKLINVYKKYGFVGFLKKLYAYVVANYFNKISFAVFFNKGKYCRQLEEILRDCDYDRIVLWRSSFGYDVPLFQRPQHIAKNLSKNKCLVFYEVTTMTDKVKIFKKQSDNIYLLNFNNIALNKLLMKALSKIDKPKYIQLYCTDWKLTVKDIEDYMSEGFKFIYEYVDDEVYVIETASALEEDVVKRRGRKNLAFSSNGVDYEYFQEYDENFVVDEEFQRVLDIGKPIVCYYGALAKWFDYELIKKIDAEGKYSVVLFGIKYDDAFDESGINELENVHFLGTRDYKVLKYYAQKCDVLTIPFILNNITAATSPVKIFEYMAMHKPIVITDLKECRQYKSVMIAKTHEEFIQLIEEALSKENDEKSIALLDKEARENDWQEKAKVIVDTISKDE